VLSEVREAVGELRELISGFEPDRLDGDVARELVEAFSEVEQLGAAGKALAARRVTATGSWKRAGSYRDAASWMAAVSGTTIGQAVGVLQTAERLGSLPETEAAVRAGQLSAVQAEAISAAATADPASESMLIEQAHVDGVKGLRNTCAQVQAAAYRDEHAREEAIYRERSLRLWTDRHDGAGHIAIRGPVDSTARVIAALEPVARELLDTARADGRCEHTDAIAFDALAEMATTGGGGTSGTVVNIRIDHSAFVRGHTEAGEICEIAGVGPIPVSIAQRLADDAFLKALIVDGTDVLAVSHLGEGIPARLRSAVEDLYPECCHESCNTTSHLEIDHNIPREEHGPTELWNLQRLCSYHHRYKHTHQLRLVGNGTHKHFVPAPSTRAGPSP
jgi:hypothetical protein